MWLSLLSLLLVVVGLTTSPSASVVGWSVNSLTSKKTLMTIHNNNNNNRINPSALTLTTATTTTKRQALLSSDIIDRGEFLENDLLSIQVDGKMSKPRLCVITPDGTIAPLCQHEDDVETDLFIDPRRDDLNWDDEDIIISSESIKGRYGEGWYGQRPVPSLGGGPGYGAPADDIWSIDEELFEKLEEENVEIPILDVGIAHGEQARGGAF